MRTQPQTCRQPRRLLRTLQNLALRGQWGQAERPRTSRHGPCVASCVCVKRHFPLAPLETGGPTARAPRHPRVPMPALSLG